MTNILIVENNSKIRKQVQDYLTRCGYTAGGAADSHQAISEFQRQAFDLILIDLALPGFSGVELCAWIRARSDVPIIICIIISAACEESWEIPASCLKTCQEWVISCTPGRLKISDKATSARNSEYSSYRNMAATIY